MATVNWGLLIWVFGLKVYAEVTKARAEASWWSVVIFEEADTGQKLDK